MAVGTSFAASKVEGNVERPNKLKATVTRSFGQMTVQIDNDFVDGNDAYNVTGTLNAELVAQLVGVKFTVGSLKGDIWIDVSDQYVRKLTLVDAIAANEPPNITRTLVLSHFNEPVTISEPT